MFGGQYFAFVAEDQNGKLVAHQKAVRIGEMTGNDYVVLDGIKAGDKVIVSGVQFLVDGAAVTPGMGLERGFRLQALGFASRSLR